MRGGACTEVISPNVVPERNPLRSVELGSQKPGFDLPVIPFNLLWKPRLIVGRQELAASEEFPVVPLAPNPGSIAFYISTLPMTATTRSSPNKSPMSCSGSAQSLVFVLIWMVMAPLKVVFLFSTIRS
jgi:hypothetical protein